MSNFGFHLQYKVVDPIEIPLGLIQWSGVDVTIGMDFANFTLKASKAYAVSESKSASLPAPINTVVLTSSYSGTVAVESKTKVKSFPIEVSTSVDLLYFLSIYGGLGVDINSGKTDIVVDGGADASISESTGQVFTTPITAQANLDLGGSAGPKSFSKRYFIGTQLNIFLLKIYAQLNSQIGADPWSVGVGARIAW